MNAPENGYLLVCPYTISFPRKTKEDKKYSINLNSYRNWKPIVNNLIKLKYLEYMEEQLNLLPFFEKIYVIYKPYYSRGGSHDKGNVLSVTQKYLLDAMVHTETISDDNDSIVDIELFLPGDVDKGNERVEVIIFGDKRNFKEYIKKHL